MKKDFKKEKIKIAILYIGIGEYFRFYEKFYESCIKNFCPNIEKTFYVFTDMSSNKPKSNDTNYIYQEDLGWPGNTLFRFNMFTKIKTQLENYDYIYFFNSNYLFVSLVTEEILPTNDENNLINLSWKKVNLNKKYKYQYERNKKSQAYIPFDKGEIYYQGGMYGGTKEAFFEMVLECKRMVELDIENGIIAKNNDESYLNKYLLNKKIKVVHEEFGMPEEWGINKEVKMILRDKNKVLGLKTIIEKKGNIYSFKSRIKVKKTEIINLFYYLYSILKKNR